MLEKRRILMTARSDFADGRIGQMVEVAGMSPLPIRLHGERSRVTQSNC